MFAGIVTEASTADCQFGIIFMDTRRYPYMCGHGIIGAVTTFIEMGWLPGKTGNACVAVDTPSGVVLTTAVVKKASNELVRVESVCVQMESAFAFLIDQALDVPGYGKFTVDVSFAGGFFVMVPVDQTGLTLTRKDAPKLAHMGMAIIEASNQQIEVQHPSRPYIRSIDVVEFYDPKGHKTLSGKNIVVLGEGHVDRSPCGTGTSAKMALLYSRGELGVGKKFINEGLTGMTFEGTIDREINVGGIPGIVPKIRGTAYITGMHRFVLRPDDPFPEGFLI